MHTIRTLDLPTKPLRAQILVRHYALITLVALVTGPSAAGTPISHFKAPSQSLTGQLHVRVQVQQTCNIRLNNSADLIAPRCRSVNAELTTESLEKAGPSFTVFTEPRHFAPTLTLVF